MGVRVRFRVVLVQRGQTKVGLSLPSAAALTWQEQYWSTLSLHQGFILSWTGHKLDGNTASVE